MCNASVHIFLVCVCVLIVCLSSLPCDSLLLLLLPLLLLFACAYSPGLMRNEGGLGGEKVEWTNMEAKTKEEKQAPKKQTKKS